MGRFVEAEESRAFPFERARSPALKCKRIKKVTTVPDDDNDDEKGGENEDGD